MSCEGAVTVAVTVGATSGIQGPPRLGATAADLPTQHMVLIGPLCGAAEVPLGRVGGGL
jgi:hypothetical protein